MLQKLRLTHENHEIVNSSIVLLSNTLPFIEDKDSYLLTFLHETHLSTQQHWLSFYHLIKKMAPYLQKTEFQAKLVQFLTQEQD